MVLRYIDFKIYKKISMKILYLKDYKWLLLQNQRVRNDVFVKDGTRHWPSTSKLFKIALK